MTKEQFLLMKLAEECAEVAQRCTKQIQFGKFEMQKDQTLTNSERLKGEILDFIAMVGLLQQASEITPWTNKEYKVAFKAKKEKLQKYLDLSAKLGQLPEIKL